jgi:integrase
MSTVDKYRQLAKRENTVKSYADAVRHFEVEWNGRLPASSDTVARYLAELAPIYATATLRARLAGLAHWHISNGFVDPTKAPIVREVFRGIRRAHTAPLRQAKPIELDQLEAVNNWIEAKLSEAPVGSTEGLRLARDRAMLLLGFWRGFRSDELTRLRIENIKVDPGKGLTWQSLDSRLAQRFGASVSGAISPRQA